MSERRLITNCNLPAAAMNAAAQEGFQLKTLAAAIMAFHRAHNQVRFPLGRVVATPGALELFERAKTSGHRFLARHLVGDWGDLAAEDLQANEAAIANGSRILSAYMIGDEKLWIITEADRSSTCLLLPSEY